MEAGAKQSEVAKEFGIAKSTVATFLKNKNQICSSTQSGDRKRKRDRAAQNADLDECVAKWFKQSRDKKIPLSGPLLQAKAEQFALKLGKPDFKASNGWLEKFRGRHNIVFRNVCGESGGVDASQADKWFQALPEIIADTDPANIFNVDETGLFYKCTPDKTLALKGEVCSTGKLSKERVTILVGANMTGSEKLPLLMIGKSRNPRCFKNLKSKPIEYEANRKAWMTSEIFEQWLLRIDKRFARQKRQVLLFMDNCAAHNRIPKLKNIRVVFFPPNMTSVVQPMDQGVIKNFKHFYRRLLVEKFLDNEKPVINVLEAARLSSAAWDQVTCRTIENCFRKAGFVNKSTEVNSEESNPSAEIMENSDPDFEYFVNIDENLVVCGEETEDDIIAEVVQKKSETSDDEEELESDEANQPVPTPKQAIQLIEELQRFVEAQPNVDEAIFRSLNKLKKFASQQQQKNLTQRKLSDFFGKSG